MGLLALCDRCSLMLEVSDQYLCPECRAQKRRMEWPVLAVWCCAVFATELLLKVCCLWLPLCLLEGW